MDKTIWSNTMTNDSLYNLGEDDLRNALANSYGYEEDMLDTLDYNGLKQLVLDDDNLSQIDIEDFEDYIAPEISKQSKDGIIILSGTAGRWDGNKNAGKAVSAEDLISGDICKDCDHIAIIEDDETGNLCWEASHHDGTHYMGLYAVPEDREKFTEFLKGCMQDYLEEEMSYDPELTPEDISDYAYDYDLGADTINNYCDFSKVPSVCEPIKLRDYVESLEQPIEEAKSKEPEQLEYELAEIEADYEDFGPEGFYAVPFTSFEKQFPEFTKVCVRKFLEELEILNDDELADTELLNEYWKEGELIQPDDWPCLLDGAKRLISTRKDKGIQWAKIWAAHSHIE